MIRYRIVEDHDGVRNVGSRVMTKDEALEYVFTRQREMEERGWHVERRKDRIICTRGNRTVTVGVRGRSPMEDTLRH